MRETIFMRLLLCKIHCPLMCFCNHSAAHIYASGPLKLESAPHIVSTTAFAVSGKSSIEGVDSKHTVLKSCIRKPPQAEVAKKRVHWLDSMGKELAEIREFESSQDIVSVRQVIQIMKKKATDVSVSFSEASR